MLLKSKIQFIIEIDRLKQVLRQSLVIAQDEAGSSRRENTAEHSWHLATSVLVLASHSNEKLDLLKALKMALIHDIVEIDAGDTYVYDESGNETKKEREQKAAQRLFSIIMPPLGDELKALWREFELGRSSEAKFVAAVDRLLPLIANTMTGGHSWKKHQIRAEQVYQKCQVIASGSDELGDYAAELIESATRAGLLLES